MSVEEGGYNSRAVLPYLASCIDRLAHKRKGDMIKGEIMTVIRATIVNFGVSEMQTVTAASGEHNWAQSTFFIGYII